MEAAAVFDSTETVHLRGELERDRWIDGDNGKQGLKQRKAEPGKKASVGVRVPKPKTEKATKPEDAVSRKNKEKNLGKEAHSVMDEQVSKIVETLLGQTMKGKVKSAQMLVKLAKKESNAKEALRWSRFGARYLPGQRSRLGRIGRMPSKLKPRADPGSRNSGTRGLFYRDPSHFWLRCLPPYRQEIIG